MPADPSPAPSFEQALDELEKIVASMESGEIPLDELLAKYEAGTRLLRQCEGRLKDAELRIELLRKQAGNGAPVLSKFEPTAE